jgi:hypothetical protein
VPTWIDEDVRLTNGLILTGITVTDLPLIDDIEIGVPELPTAFLILVNVVGFVNVVNTLITC